MTMMRATCTLVMLLHLVACGPLEGELMEEGQFCGEHAASCIDYETILICKDRTWAEVTCDSQCEARDKEPAGCRHGAEIDSCVCIDPPGASCSAGDRACDPAPGIGWQCEDGQWASESCDETCGELEQPRLSAGCRDGRCTCTFAGVTCEAPVAALCDDEFTLATCVLDHWELSDCSSCEDGSGFCDPWSNSGAVCVCG